MRKFTKKPVTVEAIQWTGDNAEAVREFGGNEVNVQDAGVPVVVAVHTLEGTMFASVGDWIIKGVEGEFYPCKPTVFDKTYTPASDPVPVEGVVLPDFDEEYWDDIQAKLDCRERQFRKAIAGHEAYRTTILEGLDKAIAQRDAAREALEDLYDKYEHGDSCTENGDVDGSYMGNCVHLSYEEEEHILALIEPAPSTKPLHDGKPSWKERATAAEAALATERARVLQEAFHHVDGLHIKMEFPTNFSKGREEAIEQSSAVIRSLFQK